MNRQKKIVQFYSLAGRSQLSSQFMNFGVFPLPKGIPCTAENRSIQLGKLLIEGERLSGSKALDIGCGKGGLVALILKANKTVRATGLDLTPQNIAICKARIRSKRSQFIIGDAHSLPIKSAEFDIVSNLESSHSYRNRRIFFEEVLRVLKPGGHFLYADLMAPKEHPAIRTIAKKIGFNCYLERELTSRVLSSIQCFLSEIAAETNAYPIAHKVMLSAEKNFRENKLEYHLFKFQKFRTCTRSTS